MVGPRLEVAVARVHGALGPPGWGSTAPIWTGWRATVRPRGGGGAPAAGAAARQDGLIPDSVDTLEVAGLAATGPAREHTADLVTPHLLQAGLLNLQLLHLLARLLSCCGTETERRGAMLLNLVCQELQGVKDRRATLLPRWDAQT